MKIKISLIFTLLFSFAFNSMVSFSKTKNVNNSDVHQITEIKNAVTASVIDKDGNIWVGTTISYTAPGIFTGELYKSTDGKHFEPINWVDSSGKNYGAVTSLAVDENGTIWAGTATDYIPTNRLEGMLLKSTDKSTFTPVPWKTGSDNNGGVFSLLVAKNGTVWAGVITYINYVTRNTLIGGNLYKSTDKENFSLLTWHDGKTTYGGAISLAMDKDGAIWAGAIRALSPYLVTGGLYKTNDDTHFQPINMINKNIHNIGAITSILFDNNNDLMVGTMTDGFVTGALFKSIDKSSFNIINWNTGPYNNGSIAALTMDKNSNIWAGTMILNPSTQTFSGVVYESNKDEKKYISVKSVSGGIKNLLFDSSGNLLIGTVGGYTGANIPGGLYIVNVNNVQTNLLPTLAWIFVSVLLLSAIVLVSIYIIKANNSYYKNK